MSRGRRSHGSSRKASSRDRIHEIDESSKRRGFEHERSREGRQVRGYEAGRGIGSSTGQAGKREVLDMTRGDLPSSPRCTRDGRYFWRDDKGRDQSQINENDNRHNQRTEKGKNGDSVVSAREVLARAAVASAARIAAAAVVSKER